MSLLIGLIDLADFPWAPPPERQLQGKKPCSAWIAALVPGQLGVNACRRVLFLKDGRRGGRKGKGINPRSDSLVLNTADNLGSTRLASSHPSNLSSSSLLQPDSPELLIIAVCFSLPF